MGFNIETVKNGGIYTSCIWLQGCAYLGYGTMLHCCNKYVNYGDNNAERVALPVLAPSVTYETNFDDAFFNQLYENKLEYIRKINDNEPCECTGCVVLQNKEWEPMPKLNLSRLAFVADCLCNANCVYCSQNHAARSFYDVYGFIKSGIEHNYINPNDSNGYVLWAGGEPTLMANFNEIIDSVVNMGEQVFLTTCIKFDESIAKYLEHATRGGIVVSIDSGTRETYAKIKGVDQFNKVVENFKMYYGRAKDKSCVSFKYIMTEDNCSEHDIDSLIKVIDDNKLHGISVIIDTDYRVPELSSNIRAGVYYMALKLPLVNRKKLVCGTNLIRQMPDFATRLNVKEVGELSKIKYFFDMFLSEGSVQKDIALKLYYKVKDFYSWSRKFAHQYLHQNNNTK